jgi:hypothetical protein
MAPSSWFRRLHRAFGLVDDAAEANAAEQHGAQTIRMFLRVLISLDGGWLFAVQIAMFWMWGWTVCRQIHITI